MTRTRRARWGRWTTWTAVTAVVGTAALALAGCGIPTEATARGISANAVPFGLLSRVPPTTTPKVQTNTAPVEAYFTRTGRYVVPEPRGVTPHDQSSVTAVVAVMLRGPTPDEELSGISTALVGGNGDIKLLSSRTASGTLILNFNPTFAQLSGSQLVLGVAQVVFTVAGVRGPQVGVLFEIGGYPTDVPISNGSLVSVPVHVAQYATLVPPQSTTPSSTG